MGARDALHTRRRIAALLRAPQPGCAESSQATLCAARRRLAQGLRSPPAREATPAASLTDPTAGFDAELELVRGLAQR